MRAILGFLGSLLVVAAVALLVVFVIQNTQAAHASVAGQSFATSLGWLIGGAAILGFLVAVVLTLPGWAAAGRRGRRLRRTTLRAEQELEAQRRQHDQLRDQHERLQAMHRQIVTDRNWWRSRVGQEPNGTTPSAPAQQPPAPAPAANVAPTKEAPPTRQTPMGGPVAPQPQQPTRREDEWSPNSPPGPTA
jgi:uncharacterized integral membrane protein